MNALTDRQNNDLIIRFANQYDVPAMGVTILGGNPYVNAAGLMAKAKKLGLKSVKIEIQKQATPEDMSAIVKATVKLKDGSEFEDVGFGSKASIKMSTLHNPDFITMTTITRAKNRALRSATGFGLVSVEEMVVADGMYSASSGSSIEAEEVFNSIPSSEPTEKVEVKEVKIEKVEKKESEPSPVEPVPKEAIDEAEEAVVQAAEEVFDTKPVFKSSYKEKMIDQLAELLKDKEQLMNQITEHFMVSSIGELYEGQIEYAVKWAKTGRAPLAK